MRHRQWMQVGLLAAGLLATACGSSVGTGSTGNSASPAVTGASASATRAAAGAALLKTEKTSLGTVLADSRGHTLYWFAIDTPTRSQCAGACLTAWPAVRGTPTAAPGVRVPGTLAVLKRSDGIDQATWNGHPLYTYFGDTAVGQTNGNMINAYGGIWRAVVLSSPGAATATGSPSPSPSPSPTRSGGGGY